MLCIIAAIVGAAIIAILLIYIVRAHKKSPGPASVRYYAATVDVVAEPHLNFLREIEALRAGVKREGWSDNPDFARLQDAAHNFDSEWSKCGASRILDHPGYMPPRQQNGENRTDKSHGHSTIPQDET